MRRNFQGYTTDHHETMIGLGASSIGRFADAYVQNTVPTHQYASEIASGKLAKAKGYWLTNQDQLHGHIIERLMCDFVVDFAAINNFPCLEVEQCIYLANRFVETDQFGLCFMDGSKLVIEEEAKPFTRIIASRFDSYYQPEQFQYSKAV